MSGVQSLTENSVNFFFFESFPYGQFVENNAFLRTFCVENSAFLTKDGGRSVKDGKLRIDQGELRFYDGELRIENSEMRLKGYGLRIDH